MEEGILDLKYYNKDTWSEYFGQDVVKLYEATVRILKLFEQAKNLDLKNVFDLLNEDGYKAILLGGVKEDGSFTERSAYKFYNDVLGLELDHKTVFPNLKEGRYSSHSIRFKPNELYGKLQAIYSNLKLVLDSKNISLPNVAAPHLTDHRSVLESLREFAETGAGFLSTYNPKTFFVTSLRGSTKRAFKLVYPKIENEIFELFGVGHILSAPDLGVDDHEYDLWGYKDAIDNSNNVGSKIGSAITLTDRIIYNLLQNNILQKYLTLDKKLLDDYHSLIKNIPIEPQFTDKLLCGIREGFIICNKSMIPYYERVTRGNYVPSDSIILKENVTNWLDKISLPLIYALRIQSIIHLGENTGYLYEAGGYKVLMYLCNYLDSTTCNKIEKDYRYEYINAK